MTGEGRKPFGKFVVGAGLFPIREPGLLGHAKSDAEEDAALGRRGRRGGGGRSKAAETDGLERGKRDERSGSAEEVATVEGRFHDNVR